MWKGLLRYLLLGVLALLPTLGMADNQAVPNIFATQSGNVPASQLDVNFATVLDAGANRITATGSANTYIATSNPAITGYIPNQPFIITFPATNTGASTINFNSVGSVNLNKVTNGVENGLIAGDVIANIPYMVLSDGTNFVVANPSSGASSSQGASGYTYLPSGMIIQWGTTATILSTGNSTTTFPLTFPHNCWSVTIAAGAASSSTSGQSAVTNVTTANFTSNNSTNTNMVFYWQAIGN